jgi:parallel beta-helix repeat protein
VTLAVVLSAAVALTGDAGLRQAVVPWSERGAAPGPAAREIVRCHRVASPRGSDRSAGTRRSPVRTPRGLLRRLARGQTGCLRAGGYRQASVTLRTPGITLRSYPGERARWRGRIVIRAPGATIAGLDLDARGGPRCRGEDCILPSPTINAPRVTLRGNDITSPRGICVHPTAHRGMVPDRFVIERNRIHDCGRRPATNRDHGIYVAHGRGGVIRDNVIHGNADRGIQLFPRARGTRIERNTIDGNGQGLIYSERSADNIARRNIVSHSRIRWNVEASALQGRGNRFEDNCVEATNPDAFYRSEGGINLPPHVTRSGNVVAEPGYADRPGGDFRLRPGSACAGRGAPPAVAASPSD